MKSRIILAALAASTLFLSCARKSETPVYHVIPGQKIDLGTIREADGAVSFDVAVVNNSYDTLVLSGSRVSCSCLSVEPQKGSVAPGEEHILHMKYDPAYRSGDEQETSYVFYENKTIIITDVLVHVVPAVHPMEEDHPYDLGEGLHVSHKILNFGYVKPSESGKMFFRIGNSLRRKAVIEYRCDDPAFEYVSMRRTIELGPDERDTVQVRFNMPSDMESSDTLVLTLQPYVNGKPAAETVKVRAVAYFNYE